MVIGFSPELLFLKGMTGALAPFSYLVLNITQAKLIQLRLAIVNTSLM
jgi:hypothetical protein